METPTNQLPRISEQTNQVILSTILDLAGLSSSLNISELEISRDVKKVDFSC